MNEAMTDASRSTGPDVWDRLNVLWHGLFAVTLAIPTVIAFSDPTCRVRAGWSSWPARRSSSSAHWLVVARHPEWWERRLGVLAVYWAVACGLAALLATQHPSFMITLYGLYPLMFMTLGWWGMVPIVGLTALVGWALGGWGSGPAMITNLLATAGSGPPDRRLRQRHQQAERAAARRAGPAGRHPGGTGRVRPADRGAGRTRAAGP